jgi:pimeloyl-ACP methyl ester carboxylesterase
MWNKTLLLLLLHGAAGAGNLVIDIPSRTKAVVPVLEMRRDTGEVTQVVVALSGGSGQRGLHHQRLDDLPTDPETPYGAWRQLADRVGAVVLVDTASDHPVLDMEDRLRGEHRDDIRAVLEALRLRHPKARLVLFGSSNGAYSVASLTISLAPLVDAAILVNGNADAWAGMTHAKQPVLGVHHRRDACLHYKDSYPKARFYPLITVDDPNQPLPKNTLPRDCGPTSAHALHNRRARTFAAIGAWLVDGSVRANVD